MAKRITGYESIDGSPFTTLKRAETHDASATRVAQIAAGTASLGVSGEDVTADARDLSLPNLNMRPTSASASLER
jgi:hypothetical protein